MKYIITITLILTTLFGLADSFPSRDDFISYAFLEDYIFVNPLALCKEKGWDRRRVASLAKSVFEDFSKSDQPIDDDVYRIERLRCRVTCFSLDYYGWCTENHEITNLLFSILEDKKMKDYHPCCLLNLFHHIPTNSLRDFILDILEDNEGFYKKFRSTTVPYILINSLYFPERKEIMFNTVLAYLKEKGTIKDLVLFDDCAKYYLPDYINSPLEREILLIAKKILSANSEQNKGSQELMKRLEVMQQREQDDFNRNTERNISNNPESTSGKVILRERLLEIKRHEKGEWLRRNAWWMICGVCALLAIVFCIVAGRRRGK